MNKIKNLLQGHKWNLGAMTLAGWTSLYQGEVISEMMFKIGATLLTGFLAGPAFRSALEKRWQKK